MDNIRLLSGSADEVGLQLQENIDRMANTTRRWAEILTYDPQPQTGMTPKDTIWRKNKARLYRYSGDREVKYRTPLLFIYALINKPYILDLYPGMSLIEYLVEQGFDVYLFDWGEFNWEDRHLGYGELVSDYIARAVQKVAQFSQQSSISIAGYCMGGTMTTMYAPLYPQPEIKNIIYLAAPINFEEAGLSGTWLESPGFDPEKVVETYGLIPKDFIDTGVKMLRPVNNFVGTYTRLWKSLDEGMPVEAWRALNKWVNDNINFPGEAYRQWIKELYQENKLIKGQFRIKGREVKLEKIKSSLLVLAGENDHLVLPQQTQAILELSGSKDKTYQSFPVGHGGLVFGSFAKREVYPVISSWLAERS
ncbi:MAG: alpha/beta fold hydrolase [Syntrophomonadaceae bacterium]|nr:alpha/beta fold hydrolase [Syntrophomonadaceae bacterium]